MPEDQIKLLIQWEMKKMNASVVEDPFFEEGEGVGLVEWSKALIFPKK